MTGINSSILRNEIHIETEPRFNHFLDDLIPNQQLIVYSLLLKTGIYNESHNKQQPK